MNDRIGDARKLTSEQGKYCGESISVFGEDPTTLPMRLTQTLTSLRSSDFGQGTMLASGLQTVADRLSHRKEEIFGKSLRTVSGEQKK